jgi:hypothetical protein
LVYGVVELAMTSVTGCPWAILTPLIGDCGVGAVAFSSEPSGFALPLAMLAPLGDVGLDDGFEQATKPVSEHAPSARRSPENPGNNETYFISVFSARLT